MERTIFFLLLFLIMSCEKKPPINIYNTDEFKNLSRKDIIIGESVWVTTCFRCHTYGNMGAASIYDKEPIDRLASKGFDQLYKSVMDGMTGEGGVMPPKGSCYSCSENEIEKSIYYIFHLARNLQESEKQDNKNGDL